MGGNDLRPGSKSAAGAEFDAYAAGYAGGMDNSVKALLGDVADDFISVKVRWLLDRYPDLHQRDASFRLLDYGCGAATFLRLVLEQGLSLAAFGCDISSGMLEQARKVWPERLRFPELYQQTGAKVPVPAASFDLVVISAVLHHVPLRDRPGVYAELHRLLRPGGRLVVFEHNPLNPVTRYVVSRTPIDRNAILLRAREVCDSLRVVGFSRIDTKYLMFLPPRLHAPAALERLLGWLPLGAQYAVTAEIARRRPS